MEVCCRIRNEHVDVRKFMARLADAPARLRDDPNFMLRALELCRDAARAWSYFDYFNIIWGTVKGVVSDRLLDDTQFMVAAMDLVGGKGNNDGCNVFRAASRRLWNDYDFLVRALEDVPYELARVPEA